MKLKHFVAGALLAGASFGAFAGDQSIDVLSLGKTYAWTAFEGDGILSGGEDVIKFGSNLAAGTYKISVTVSAQDLELFTTSNLNGALGSVTNGEFVFYSSKYTGVAPFTLTLKGLAGSEADYSGTYKVTAVPEPTTYAMLLGGLGLVGMVARRKAKKAA